MESGPNIQVFPTISFSAVQLKKASFCEGSVSIIERKWRITHCISRPTDGDT